MTSVEEWAKATGAVGVRLNSGETRKNAHKFYEHIGYDLSRFQARFAKLFDDDEAQREFRNAQAISMGLIADQD
jgi:hypothetical protein